MGKIDNKSAKTYSEIRQLLHRKSYLKVSVKVQYLLSINYSKETQIKDSAITDSNK
jgi:hypothetical protein